MSDFLDPNLESLQQTLQSLFEIPVYQRPYKWEREQILELFKDIMEEYSLGGRFFLGTFFLSLKGSVTSNKNIYEVIDGQQRITTISLILLAIFSIFNEKGIDDPSKDVDLANIKNLLWKQKGLTNNRELRLITSGQLEKSILENLFNWCLDSPKDFFSKVRSEEKENKEIFAASFYENILYIKDCINDYVLSCEKSDMEGASPTDKLKLFYRYLADNVFVITITLTGGVNPDRKKLFEIFESINGKGRKLDEIDLIKSYIFQNIDISDYDAYLGKWGELIKKTDDNLSEYLAVFINAKIKFYKNTINVKIFKSFSIDKDKGLMWYYSTDTLSDTLKRFIDDMVSCVDCYVKLVKENTYLINDEEFKFYTEVMRKFNYSHPKALLFRAYCDYVSNAVDQIQKKQLINIAKNSVIFMLVYQTLQQKDSRETAGKFENFMKMIYEHKLDYYDLLRKKMQSELNLASITDESIKEMLFKHIGYETAAKSETKMLLCAYECYDNEKKKFAFDKMTAIIKEKNIQVDHIAVKKPESTDENYKYYCDKDSDGNEILVLKPGNDFESNPNVNSGMDYDLFLAKTLNRTGNLQLMWGSENRDKSNGVVEYLKYESFYTYNDIVNRATRISEVLMESGLFSIQ